MIFAVLAFSLILLSVVFVYGWDRLLGYAVAIGVLARLAVFTLEMNGIWAPPGCCMDAFRFRNMAEALSGQSWAAIWEYWSPRTGLYISMSAALMKMADFYERTLMIWTNMVLGVWVLCLAAVIGRRLWGRRVAFVITLIMALYPFAIFNSVTALREEPAIFCFMLGLLMFLSWVRTGRAHHLIVAVTGFGFATFFHPGFIAAFVGLGGYLVAANGEVLRGMLRGWGVSSTGLQNLLAGGFVLSLLLALIMGGYIELGKDMDLVDRQLSEMVGETFTREEAIGGSAYPTAIVHGDPFSQPWLIPARIVYLLYAPFPWDIRSVTHLLGVVSPILYFFLTFHITKTFRTLAQKPETLALLCMFAAFTFIFAMGVTNIGTGLRHKTKFLILPLLLAGGGLQRSKLLSIASIFERRRVVPSGPTTLDTRNSYSQKKQD